MINPMELEGRTILITGASSGIGKESALLLSKLGARLVLVSRNSDKLNEVLEKLDGKGHCAFSFDLRNISEIEAFIKNIVSHTGPFNGFVHSAGISVMRPIKMTSYDFLHEIMTLNFYSFVELTRCIGKKNNSVNGASFIGISSVSSVKGNISQGAYSASKAALNGIVRPMAKEYSQRKIRINSVLFGMIKTEMFEGFINNGGDISLWKDQYLGIGETEDAANVIAFLLSDASKLITGSNFIADNGYLS